MERYEPSRGPDPREVTTERLAEYLESELRRIANAFALTDQGRQAVLYAAPGKPRQGQVVYADGVTWNPGAGPGEYVFDGSLWLASSAPRIVAYGRLLNRTAASGTIVTFTPATDGTYEIGGNFFITSAVTLTSVQLQYSFTDESGAAKTVNMIYCPVGSGGTLFNQANWNTGLLGLNVCAPHRIRAKGGNAISLQTTPAGTYTTVDYNVEAQIARVV